LSATLKVMPVLSTVSAAPSGRSSARGSVVRGRSRVDTGSVSVRAVPKAKPNPKAEAAAKMKLMKAVRVKKKGCCVWCNVFYESES
jgi:hypothetical protein